MWRSVEKEGVVMGLPSWNRERKWSVGIVDGRSLVNKYRHHRQPGRQGEIFGTDVT